MNDILTYEFNDSPIEFLMMNDVMVNATHMGAIYKRDPSEFLKTKGAVNLITALKKRSLGQKRNPNIDQSHTGDIEHNDGDIISLNLTPIVLISKGQNGTEVLMHRWLAIDFALYLDVELKIWVLERIDYLFMSYTQSQRKLVLKENQLQTERRKLIEANEANAAVMRLAVLDEELKDIRNKKSYETRKTYNSWKLQL